MDTSSSSDTPPPATAAAADDPMERLVSQIGEVSMQSRPDGRLCTRCGDGAQHGPYCRSCSTELCGACAAADEPCFLCSSYQCTDCDQKQGECTHCGATPLCTDHTHECGGCGLDLCASCAEEAGSRCEYVSCRALFCDQCAPRELAQSLCSWCSRRGVMTCRVCNLDVGVVYASQCDFCQQAQCSQCTASCDHCDITMCLRCYAEQAAACVRCHQRACPRCLSASPRLMELGHCVRCR